MDDNLEEVIADFVVESREHLENVGNELLQIEERGRDIDTDLVNKVFRSIHSIKGVAGFLDFDVIGDLAHTLENVLDLIRKQKLVPTSTVVDVMLGAADALAGMIDDVQNSNDVDTSPHIQRLSAILEGCSGSVASAEGADTGDGDRPRTGAAAEGARPRPGPLAGAAPASPPPRAHGAPEAPVPETRARRDTEPQRVESNIRVQVTLLDRLMNLAGELVLVRNQMLQSIAADNHEAMAQIAGRLDQVTSELQGAVMQTRLQPIGNVFSRFPRVVRDLSSKLGKRCELHIGGREVDLDKTLIEAISDPLTHLVRNAIDHGLETPEERRAAGKPESGTIRLHAFHQGGKVNVSISDDGRGIDPHELAESAIRKGVISRENAAARNERELLDLIFAPGFSTAAEVTDVSGRGVGMDVVRSNLERLGGTVEISNTVGRGATFTVKIPLTLAILAAMVVSCNERRYAIPQANIRELVRVRSSELDERIPRIRGHEVLRLRGSLLPVVRLSDVLDPGGGQEDAGDTDDAVLHPHPGALNVIIVESGSCRFGIVVDEGLDVEEIVVKPLGRHAKMRSEYAGATILGNGQVAMILDITGIASHLGIKAGDLEAAAADERRGHGTAGDQESLVLFRNNAADQFALPLSMLARIERIRSEDIHVVGEQMLYECRDRALPLIRLEDHIHTRPMELGERCYVLVTTVGDHELGLLVPDLRDIRNLSMDLDTGILAEPGVFGAFQLDGTTTRLIDIGSLSELAFPDWFEQAARPAESGTARSPRILLAEDSRFFRSQIRSFIESEGYEVVDCVDGREAWNILCDPEQEFDAVVTDLEMPDMDGLALCRLIKGEERLRHLPVMAVTSLASETDKQHGTEAGLDAYEIKLAKQSMLETLGRLVAAVV